MTTIRREIRMLAPDSARASTGGHSAQALDPRVARFEHWLKTADTKIADAYKLAQEIHAEDKRKDGKPYTVHLVEVALFLIEQLQILDPELITAGLLHDSVEDHPEKISIAEIKSKFGDRVGNIVAKLSVPEMTDAELAQFGTEKEKQWAKIHHYQEHVRDAITDDDVFVLKITDFCQNALKLSHLYNKAQLQSRLANKYLDLVKLFEVRARACKHTERALWIADALHDAVPEVTSYAKAWEHYPELIVN